jgi:hypothetical protein
MDCRGLCPRNDNLNRLCEEQSDEAIHATMNKDNINY